MKLSKEALLEIVAIVQDGLLGAKDISQSLRELDLEPSQNEAGAGENKLLLTRKYIVDHPRAHVWVGEEGGET